MGNLLAIERLRSKLAADLHDNIGSGLTEISILSEVISKKINPGDSGDTYSELFSYTDISFRSENIKSLEKVSLSMEHRQHLYLIFKEAINNSVTHSGCHEITLDALVKGRKLEMVLKDNGKGFCLDEVSNGNGLSNIKERAKTIGGALTINSKEGEGTVIQFVGNIL